MIDKIKINDLKMSEYNPRQMNQENKEKLIKSLKKYGLVDPILIRLSDKSIIGGHQRYQVLKEINNNKNIELNLLKMGDAGWVFNSTDVSLKTEEEVKALNLALNKISGSWDDDKLEKLLEELIDTDLDLELTGFDDLEIDVLVKDLEETVEDVFEDDSFDEITVMAPESEKVTPQPSITNNKPVAPAVKETPSFTPPTFNKPTVQDEADVEIDKKYKEYQDNRSKILKLHDNDNNMQGNGLEKFLIYPVSILSMRKSFWKETNKHLKKQIADFTETREELMGMLGTSLTDPFLVYLLVTWFTPTENKNNCKILDPFAGDSITGWISSSLGNKFTGIELRQEQVNLNNERLKKDNLDGKYICDTAENVLKHIKRESMDFIISCPPYYDLEVYSDLENDASNQKTYEDYLKIMQKSLTDSIATLKENRFGAIIISDIRDEAGMYRRIPDHLRAIISKNYCGIYNNIILEEPVGTASKRVNRAFKNRKIVKTHQEIIIFYKGNPNNIQEHFKDINNDKLFKILTQ